MDLYIYFSVFIALSIFYYFNQKLKIRREQYRERLKERREEYLDKLLHRNENDDTNPVAERDDVPGGIQGTSNAEKE